MRHVKTFLTTAMLGATLLYGLSSIMSSPLASASASSDRTDTAYGGASDIESAVGEASVLRFSGLLHFALDTDLSKRLVIRDFDAPGAQGVLILLGGTRAWSSERLRVVPSSLLWMTTFTATGTRAGQPVAPSLAVRESCENAAAGVTSLSQESCVLGFGAAFGESTYRIEIFDGPDLVLSASGFSSGEEALFSGNDFICDALGKAESVALGICEWVVSPEFRQNDAGECEWTLTSGERKEFLLNDGSRILGDRIRFIENLSSAPREATFRTMSILASEVELIELDKETIGEPIE